MGGGEGVASSLVYFFFYFPCAALAYCFGPPPSSVTARSVFSALMVARLSRILSWGGGVGYSE